MPCKGLIVLMGVMPLTVDLTGAIALTETLSLLHSQDLTSLMRSLPELADLPLTHQQVAQIVQLQTTLYSQIRDMLPPPITAAPIAESRRSGNTVTMPLPALTSVQMTTAIAAIQTYFDQIGESLTASQYEQFYVNRRRLQDRVLCIFSPL